MTAPPTVVLVPGLREHVAEHWQTRLAATLPGARLVEPMGPAVPRLDIRVAALDSTVRGVGGPVVIVAHSAGVLVTVHWASRCAASLVVGALLATPPDLARPLPAPYPSLEALHAHGWSPLPLEPLPFPSILAASDDDPLGDPVRLRALAAGWGSRWHSIGSVGHLNPASGFGAWPDAVDLLAELTAEGGHSDPRISRTSRSTSSDSVPSGTARCVAVRN